MSIIGLYPKLSERQNGYTTGGLYGVIFMWVVIQLFQYLEMKMTISFLIGFIIPYHLHYWFTTKNEK